MKKRLSVLLLLPALAFLAGCVTAYRPVLTPATDDYYLVQESEAARGVYFGSAVAQYSNMGIYPWWSIDYFYLGYHPYSHWRFNYYSPNFYPHYYSVYYPSSHWRHHYRHRGSGFRTGPGRRVNEHHRDREIINRRPHLPRSPEAPSSQRRVTVAPVPKNSHRVRLDPVRLSGLNATVRPASTVSAPVTREAPRRSKPNLRTQDRRAIAPVRVQPPSRSGPARVVAAPSQSSGQRRSVGPSRDRKYPGRARHKRKRD